MALQRKMVLRKAEVAKQEAAKGKPFWHPEEVDKRFHETISSLNQEGARAMADVLRKIAHEMRMGVSADRAFEIIAMEIESYLPEGQPVEVDKLPEATPDARAEFESEETEAQRIVRESAARQEELRRRASEGAPQNPPSEGGPQNPPAT